MDMPTIYPMRFPAIPNQRQPTNIDELMPSTYMGQPGAFQSSMQQVGKMLSQKNADLNSADEAALKFGPTVDPGQIAALNSFLFRHGGTPYGGVMNAAGTAPLQVPGGPDMDPFNTAGQTGAQTNAEQAATLKARQDAAAAQQQLARDRMDQQEKQFAERTKQREAQLLETKINHDRTDLRMRQLQGQRLAMVGEKSKQLALATGYHRGAATAFSNASKTQSLIAQKEKNLANNFTMSPDDRAKELAELDKLHKQAEDENENGRKLDKQATDILDAIGGGAAPAPRATPAPAAPAARPTRPNGSRWFTSAELANHPDAAKQIPAGMTGGWFKADGTLDAY